MSSAIQVDGPVPLVVDELAPRRMEIRGAAVFADFGQDAYGTVSLEFTAPPPAGEMTIRLGEKLTPAGCLDRTPPGSVNYREIRLVLQPSQRQYRLSIPGKPFHEGKESVRLPPALGEVTPFRYAELEGGATPLPPLTLRGHFVHAPFNEDASAFACSDETLNAVWSLCKQTMKATTVFGVYIDGERERIPYEGDAYINQLSHYACDLDPRVARATFAHLLVQPSWPTEWSLHMPLIAAADYRATGDPVLARTHYEALRRTLLMEKARGDGLLVASAIVDWPAGERDGYNDNVTDPLEFRQVGPMVNTVANAFYCHALGEMAMLARVLGKPDEVRELECKRAQATESFNRVFLDPDRGLYRDGEGSSHISLHANLFPLAFGLAPGECVPGIADFLESRGMACSVYGAQYLLEALFKAGRDRYAVSLMAARTQRSWWHMLEAGSTLTWEAWDVAFKKNLTWNHAWGAAPANLVSRFVLGVRPLEPGYAKILVAPQPGSLNWARGKVPTAAGPVQVQVANDEIFRLELELPVPASVILPARRERRVWLDGRPVDARLADGILTVETTPGRHSLESR